MNWLIFSVLIALANNIDNIGVRIAYSIKGIKLDVLKNIWISVITFIISTLAAIVGSAVSGAVGTELCKIMSLAVLCGIGLWFIFEPFIKKNKKIKEQSEFKKESILSVITNPEQSDMDNSKSIDFKEATLLGVSLSINNVGGSLSGGMIGLNALLIGLLSAVISFLALWIGNRLTDVFLKLNLGRKASIAAGIVLVLIGIKQII